MSRQDPAYALSRTLHTSVSDADQRTREALKEEGFGVLTEIDVSATLKEKLDADIPPYTILGACAPALAHQALQSEPAVGLLLPCNVVVREGPEPGTTIVQALDPELQLSVADNEELRPLAREVRERMQRVIASLGEG